MLDILLTVLESLFTRGVVAMAGTFGYELDLKALTKEEKENHYFPVLCHMRNFLQVLKQ